MQNRSDPPDPIKANLSESDVTTVLRSFLMSVLPGDVQVMLGQQNQTAPPVGPFVLMTIILRQQIATNGTAYAGQSRIVKRQSHLTIQASAFGPGAGDNIQRITTMFRDPYAVEFFAAQNQFVTPLYADAPRQMPLVNAERQYENEWSADLHLQANYQYTIPQQFADAATIELINVDAAYSESKA